MNRELPPYASSYRDRHGKMRVRLRRTGFPTCYPKAPPGTEEFWEEYLAWKNGAPVRAGEERAVPGTFDDLITRFYSSVKWKNIPKESTRQTYRGELERFRAKYGSRQVATMSARAVNGLMEKMADTPAAANNLLKRLRTLFDYAILLGMRRDNPAKAVDSVKAKGDGFHEWTEAEIAKFKRKHPLGSKARLALEIFLCTAQRRSDAATMGEDPDKPDYVKVRQLKTDTLLSIRIHRDLRTAITAAPSGKPTFLVSERGTPYTKESLGNWFKRQCVDAGLPHCSAHGLRKAAARRMAELGLSNQLIKSITGHLSDSEVTRYTKNADQARRADKAMEQIEGFGAPDLAHLPENA
jgi:site-specific recombinase XerD